MAPIVDPHRGTALAEFASVAESFCAFVEADSTLSSEDRLHDLHELLARLYLAALLLPDAFSLLSDEEARTDSPITVAGSVARHAEVVARLAPVFGERNSYREVFDPYAPDTDREVLATLTDDVADIYGHLRDGLDFWSAGSFGNALFEWRFNFECHWAEHASGALRALFARSAWHDLGWRPGAGVAP